MKRIALLSLALFFLSAACSYADTNDSIPSKKKEKKKKGWTFGALPVIAYDADLGVQLGVLGQVFYYGDGSTYPEYLHTIYGEISRFTKGSGVNQLFYDSKHLIPGNIRVTAEVSYLTERALDFYGFNGYEARYIPSLSKPGSEDYISKAYYRYERKMLRIMLDFQGPIIGNKFRWLAGINLFDIHTATVNISLINKGKKESNQLPDTTLLYDEYVDWGLIGPQEKNGGMIKYLKLGLIYDTRDNETAPDKGIWSEVLLLAAPTFLGNNPYAFVKLAVAHRQFVPIVQKKLIFAYRLAYQGTIGGTAPFYIQPYLYTSFALNTKPDGLGGSRTIRGVLRNRVVGDGVVYGNLELRWKFLKTLLFKQNFYLGVLGFLDGGMVVQDDHVPKDLVQGDPNLYFDQSKDSMHWSTGIGLRAALNENFLIAVDWGFSLDKRDGTNGLYLGIGHIF